MVKKNSPNGVAEESTPMPKTVQAEATVADLIILLQLKVQELTEAQLQVMIWKRMYAELVKEKETAPSAP